MSRAFLPCESQQWPEDKKYFTLLSKIKSPDTFKSLVDEHVAKNRSSVGKVPVSLSQRVSCLEGLAVFMTEFASREETDVFFDTTLPFICRSASCLDVLIPDEGVPFLKEQEAASVQLGRKLILSLVANAFLCTFPHEHPLGKSKGYKPFTFEKFFKVLASGDGSRQSSQSAKLRCILNYFYRMSKHEEEGNPGIVTLTRQVVSTEQLPSIADWKESLYPLCPLSISSTCTIEDTGSRSLQVDFAASHIGGGTLAGGRVQEEIRFSICPELLVSILIMERMDDNEAILIMGAERFASYTGYGATLKYDGDYKDPSERDIYGNLNTSLVAIDAINFQGKFKLEEQYKEEIILREINKAFVGFLCRDERGDLILNQVALNQGEYDELDPELSMLEDSSQVTADDLDLEDNEEGVGANEEGADSNEFATQVSSGIIHDVLANVTESSSKAEAHEYAGRLVDDVLQGAKDIMPLSGAVQTHIAITSEGEPDSPRSHSSSYTGEQMLPVEIVDNVVEFAIESAIKERVERPPTPPETTATPSTPPPASETTAPPTTPPSETTASPINLPPEAGNLAAVQTTVSPSTKVNAKPTTLLEEMPVKSASNQKHQASPEPAVLHSAALPKKGSPSLTASSAGKTGKGTKSKHKKGQKSKGHSREYSGGSGRQFYSKSQSLSSTDGPHDFLDPSTIQLSLSRMSMAWSTTSTRDDGSMPPSPTELDNVALHMVENLDDFSLLVADIAIRDALAYLKTPEDLNSHLMSYESQYSSQRSKIDTFLHSLEEVGTQFTIDTHEGTLLPYSPRWYSIQKDTLRPVATGNWGCGAFKGDPQLKALLQWMAVSSSGRPELTYCTFKDARMNQFQEVSATLSKAGVTTVGLLYNLVSDYCSKRLVGDTDNSLFNFILQTF